MWMYDGSDQYYTSDTRLYLTYSKNETDISALKTAMTIGYLLNRTVILPRFHVRKKAEKLLNFFLHIKSFDKYFSGNYRESSFLLHPKAPFNVKSGFSEQNIIDNLDTYVPQRRYKVSGVDVVSQFGKLKDKVLMFKCLRNVYIILETNTENINFKLMLRRAFIRSNYRQYRTY